MPSGSITGTTTLVNHGSNAARLTFALMGDGYALADIAHWRDVCDQFVAFAYTDPSWQAIWPAINIVRIDVVSTDSGCTNDNDPTHGPTGAAGVKRTYFNTKWGTGAGYLSGIALGPTPNYYPDAAKAAADAWVPGNDIRVLVMNDPRSGLNIQGYSRPEYKFGVFDLDADPHEEMEVVLHELGHAAFGLADEYGLTGRVAPITEPTQPDVTINNDPATVKWASLIKAGTTPKVIPWVDEATSGGDGPSPFPGDVRGPNVLGNTIALFEGGQYAHTGVWRPSRWCRMGSGGHVGYCLVCHNHMLDVVAPYMPTVPVTVASAWVGDPGPTKAQVLFSGVVGITSARLVVSTSADLSAPVYSPATAVDALGNARISVTGLTASTQYYWGLEGDGALLGTSVANTRGKFKTLPRVGVPTSFSVAVGSCMASRTNPRAFADINRRDPLLAIQDGDLHYDNPGASDPALWRTSFDNVFKYSSNWRALTSSRFVPYIYDNHDFAFSHVSDQADSTSPGHETAAQVFRERVPSPALLDAVGAYYSFTVGRVLFVMTDCRAYRTPVAATDDANKTMLGAAQKAWLKSTLAASTAVLNVVVTSVEWNDPPNGHGEAWGGYSTERQELIAAFKASGVRNILFVNGNAHMLAADSGKNAPGGYATVVAAPIYQNAGPPPRIPYDFGSVNNASIFGTSTAYNEYYGWLEVLDTGGSTLKVIFTGRDVGSASDLLTMGIVYSSDPAVAPLPDPIPVAPVTPPPVDTVPREDTGQSASAALLASPRILPAVYKVLVRNPDGTIAGPLLGVQTVELTLNFDAVSTAIVTLPGDSLSVVGMTPRHGLVVYKNKDPKAIFNGRITKFQSTMSERGEGGEDGDASDPYPGTITLSCEDDLVELRRVGIYPDPRSPQVTKSTGEAATALPKRRSFAKVPAETIVRTLIGENTTATAALVDRQVPYLVQDSNRGQGVLVNYSVLAGTVLLDACRELLVAGMIGPEALSTIDPDTGEVKPPAITEAPQGQLAAMGMRAQQQGDKVVFSVYLPKDRSNDVVFSFKRHNLAGWDVEQGAPDANYVITTGLLTKEPPAPADGSTTTAKPTYTRFTTVAFRQDSIDLYGRIESWQDVGAVEDSTPAPEDPSRAADAAPLPDIPLDPMDTLRDSAKSTLGSSPDIDQVTFSPLDTRQTQFGTDYNLGDLVAVIVGVLSTVVGVVQSVRISWTREGGEVVTPTVGNYGADTPVKSQRRINELLMRNRKLEGR